MPRFNLPNRITLARLLSSLALFGVLTFMDEKELAGSHHRLSWVAWGLFVLTAATDWLDGYLARKRGEVTTLGRIMDPFVDKVVICGTFIFLASMTPEIVSPWLVVVIVSREFFVNGIRGYMESRGIAFAARMAGKIKMTLQSLAAGGVLLLIAIGDVPAREPRWLHLLCTGLVWAALVSTLYSGWIYARIAFRHLDDAEI